MAVEHRRRRQRRGVLDRLALRRSLHGLLAVMLVMLFTTGCWGGHSDEDGSDMATISGLTDPIGGVSTKEVKANVVQDKAVSHNGRTLTFGILYPFAHMFYETITEQAKAAAGPQQVSLLVQAPDEANAEQQIRMMENMINRHVDGIAVDPIDATAMQPVIDKAIAAGIPVICFESDAPGSQRLSFIGADNRLAGQRMGGLLDGLLGGRGMILVETGASHMDSLNKRLEGLRYYLETYTEIQILDVRYNEGSEATAQTDLEQMIDDHPHFDAFIALDPLSVSAAVLVWKAMGLNRHALTFGMMPEIEDAIRNGQLTATVSQYEQEWGAQIVSRLIQAAGGHKLPAFSDTGMTDVTMETLSRAAAEK
ncbi:ribose transport system substrate-binding protein [Paenibacillus cellulosilyticus]|uniref:Ribose transport system substrate-binding protein n=1 Tax=Paenibacillus cellulosilyticus TaxID=375489 RepID=A0A2V2YRY0_9BACL|nr:ribose transport system substrate-binding protein [Paenibacillus cellulosilyticus]